MQEFDRIIVGAGAAGLFTAATAEHPVKGLIIDHSHHPGLKLLLSGNGQCNITHGGSIKDFTDCYGEKGKKIRSILYSANNSMLMEFLESLGVRLMERPDGKVFPRSLKASEILNALLKAAGQKGFTLHMDEHVKGIAYADGKYILETEQGLYQTPVLILACGGKSYPKTGSDGSIMMLLEKMGIETKPQTPALAPLYVHGYAYKTASGVSFQNAKVSIRNGSHAAGETVDDLLLTHKGFSGPACINLSRYASAGMQMEINFIHPMTAQECSEIIKKSYQQEKKKISTYISKLFGIPASFTEALLEEMSIQSENKASSLDGEEIRKISSGLTSHVYEISGLGGFGEAMVTKGGVLLDEISLKTMESKKYPGLFFAGEILDVDGDTGGYNLQFAFSSAKAVSKAIK